jgi:hypothetical protein
MKSAYYCNFTCPVPFLKARLMKAGTYIFMSPIHQNYPRATRMIGLADILHSSAGTHEKGRSFREKMKCEVTTHVIVMILTVSAYLLFNS